MGARDEEDCHSPAQPKGTCTKTPPVLEEDSLQVPFSELNGEVVQYVGQAEDAIIAMSSYRLHIRFKESVVNVPLMLIESVEVREMLQLHIVCKDCKAIRCQFSSVELCQEWAKRLTGAVRPPACLGGLFSFAFHTSCVDVCAGDPEQQGDTCRPGDHVTSRFSNEVERMGFDTRGVWRISEINRNYRLCSSYPQLLLVPGWITDAELENVAAFRAWKRFPTVVYRHQTSGVVISRCAQPEVSWWGWRNADDERLVQSIAKACAGDRLVRKHTANRTANRTASRQHGYRSTSHERANGGFRPECADRTFPHVRANRRTNGGTPPELTNGSILRENPDRTVPPEQVNGNIPHESTNGCTNGGVPKACTNGGVPQECTNGAVPLECTTGGDPLECTNGGVPIECTNGGVPLECTNGGVPLECTNGGDPLECTNGGDPLECTNGGVPLKFTNGDVPLECAYGGVHHKHTNGHGNANLPYESSSGTHANGNLPNRAVFHEHTNGTSSHSELDSSACRGLEGDHIDALPQKLLILDARSYAAAVANRAKGGGCECPEYYPNCEVMFMGMANIHSIRKSFQALRSLCTQMPDPANWLSALEGTRWLQHLALLLKAALLVVTAVDRDHRPVLVHCSDGWDRTPQIVALSKLLLDPYYRTIEGFQVLVETEWLDFGHKFGERCGHGEKAEDLNERCPVFLQWLDCVHQLHRQFPCSFQFNESFLVKLVQHTYSCLFGTFLCNSGRERDMACVRERTCSLWSLMRPTNCAFQNILYSAHSETVLRPVCHVRNLLLWTAVYLPSSLPTTPSDDSCAPYPSPCGSPAKMRLARLPKTRSFENPPSEPGGAAEPNRRSSDPNLKNKQQGSLTAGATDCPGAGRRGGRPSEDMEGLRVAGEGFEEEEELKATASEDEGARPLVEGCTEEAELSVAAGVALGQIENILQEATADDEDVTAEQLHSETSLAPPLPTAPLSPPPMTPPTYLPLEGLEGPEHQVAERAAETPVAPERPEDPYDLSTDTVRTSADGHAKITMETLTEEEGLAVGRLSPCSSPPPPCVNVGTCDEAEPEGGRGLQRTPDGTGRPSLSLPPRAPAPLCNGVPQQEGAHGQTAPQESYPASPPPTSPPPASPPPASLPLASPRGAPPRRPQDGLALYSDAVQLRLRQMEAGHQLQVHTLKNQVQELWSRLESHHGNGRPGDQQSCSADWDLGADPPCYTRAELLSEPSWGRLEAQDTEVAEWFPNRLASHCYGCEGHFWLADRKHHCRGKQPAEDAWSLSARGLSGAPCRTCGKVFCTSCCEQRVPAPSRACQACRSALPPVDLELEEPITASSN